MPKLQLSFHIVTYGCQMNVRDSEIMAGLMEGQGYIEQSRAEQADIIIFNTCSVRHSAENKVYGRLGQYIRLKRQNPELIIAFGGCMAQLPESVHKIKRMGVDVIFGTHNLHQLPGLIAEYRQRRQTIIRVGDDSVVLGDLPSRRRKGTGAFVNIMYGCNNFCSYCIVPYTRGRERSRQPQDIIREVEQLAGEGFTELTFLGQNVNSYGQGLADGCDFASLLEQARQVDGIDRIRFTTSHPKDMSEKLIDTIAGSDKLCEHIHVPLQAGSDHILKLMNRGYTRQHYLRLVQKMRERIPGVAITSDLIVGFPGETEEDFLATLDMVRQIRFDAAFTFMYSIRSGTRAATMPGQVDRAVKKERLLRLNELQYRIALESNRSLEGATEEVLVEGLSKTKPDKLTGRTRSNRIVIFEGPEELIGRLVDVTITTGKTFSLFGELKKSN